MSALTNILISASAGTGKTYQLSLRFLALLALNRGSHPERLIAVTFTRKAAGEFKDRILTDLAAGATDSAGAARLRDRLWAVIKGTPEEPGLWPQAAESWKKEHLCQERFRHMLRLLVQQLSRLNLCTIDSLFAQIAATSTFELGVSGFSMIDTTAEKLARREALLTLYRECSLNPEQEQSFEDAFLSGADSDAEAADAEDSMARRLNTYHELFLDEPDAGKWGNPATLGFTPEELLPPVPLERFNAALHVLMDRARDMPAPEGRNGAKNKEMFLRFLNGFSTYVKLGRLKFHDTEKKLTMEEAREKFRDFWSPPLDELIQSWLRMETLQTLHRTRSTHGLMRIFEDKYSALIRNKGRFLFHDVTRMLGNGAVTPELKRDLQYRMYCRYDHWMLDEFQDTSQSQWRVIKPFLDDLTDTREEQEGSIFVVGDLKQSVYQWRGGDPALFRSVAGQLHLEERGMATSYRSVQPVLDMVNDICDYAQTAADCGQAALEQWGDYPPHVCAPSLASRTGCARIWQTPRAEETSANDLVCQAMADILEQSNALRRDMGVAVLVSTRNQALIVREWLTSHGWPAEVCDDVPVGQDSPLGKTLLSFFRWLLSPGDAFISGLLSHSPLHPLISPDRRPGMDWNGWHMVLEREGYAAVMTELEKRMALAGVELTDFHRDRLSVWMNEAEQVDERGASLDEWIRRMEDLTRREDPSGGIVRIMTIHKSKGLGFDMVILPQIGKDAPFADSRHLTHFVKRDGNGLVEGIVMAPSKQVYTAVPQFHALYESWKATQQFDGFCKLYVALTRARRACHIILPGREGKGELRTESMWKIIRSAALTASCGTEDTLPESGAECLYSRGEPEWYAELPEKDTRTEPENAPEWPVHKPLLRQRVSPSGLNGENGLFRSMHDAALRESAAFGSAVHAVFERITRWNGEDKPHWVLPPATEAERTVAACMDVPAIRELFMPAETAIVMKEQRIEAIDGNVWISGVIDRLVIDGNSACIVDFKTDHADTAEQLRERHEAQLQAYARIVSKITRIPCDRIRLMIISTHLKTVIQV